MSGDATEADLVRAVLSETRQRLLTVHRVLVAEVDAAANELESTLHWVDSAVREARKALTDERTTYRDGVLKALGPNLDANMARLAQARTSEKMVRHVLEQSGVTPPVLPEARG